MSTDDLLRLACFCDRCGMIIDRYVCSAQLGSPFKQLCRACAEIELFAAHYGGWDEYLKDCGEGEKWYE